jgi:hypothetical protein
MNKLTFKNQPRATGLAAVGAGTAIPISTIRRVAGDGQKQ